MQLLYSNEITDFLDRFIYLKDSEFRNIEIKNPTTITLTFATQDKKREYDWITLKLEFSGVINASLVDNNKLKYIDMGEGIKLKHDGTIFAFKIINSTCQIESSTIKFEEGQF